MICIQCGKNVPYTTWDIDGYKVCNSCEDKNLLKDFPIIFSMIILFFIGIYYLDL